MPGCSEPFRASAATTRNIGYVMARRHFAAVALAAIAITGSTLHVDAAATGASAFSADALEQHPSGERRAGRLQVRGEDTRYEFTRQGTPVVEITLPAHGIKRILFPAARTYMEFRGPAEARSSLNAPCQASSYQTCARDGSEEIGGIGTEIWTLGVPGGRDDIRIWWDTARRRSMREEYPGGYRLQAIKREHAAYEGLKAEQWELTYFYPGGRYVGGMVVYAQGVSLPVIERRPSGLIRHLVNIKQGVIAEDAFEVPPGYRQIALPLPQRSGEDIPMGWRAAPWSPHLAGMPEAPSRALSPTNQQP